MADEWVVVLEATGPRRGHAHDDLGLEALLKALARFDAVGMHSHERYAVQVRLAATSGAEALTAALAEWRLAVNELGGPRPELIRAEVLTLEEFERDCRVAYGGDTD